MRVMRDLVEEAACLAYGDDERVRAAGPAGGGVHGVVGDTDRAPDHRRGVVRGVLLSRTLELVEVVEDAGELPDQLGRAAPARARGQLGGERCLAHIAQRWDAASTGGLFDVAPLFGSPAGRLLEGAARRHAGWVVGFFERSEKRADGAGGRERSERIWPPPRLARSRSSDAAHKWAHY